MKRIIAYSVARSDLYRYYPILNKLNKSKKVELRIVASHIHYMKTFGKTYREFGKDFNIEKRKVINFLKDDANSMTKKISEEIIFFSKILKKRKPDVVIVLGDRYEMLAPVTACIPHNIPVVHFFGGAITLGAIDELVRHSITKMSHLHLTAHKIYSQRIKKMGEESWRIKTIGMHDLQVLKNQKQLSLHEIKKQIKLNLKNIVTFHPTSREKISQYAP